MSKQTTQGFNFTGEMFTASVEPWQELPFHLCFASGAKLTLNPDGSATFEGDADEAAQMFFDGVVKLHNRQYQKLEAAEKRIAELDGTLEREREKSRRVMSRNAELEANQQKIESMSAFSDERLQEIEKHRDNSLLGDLPADLARELRQTRSRLGNYYELLRRADVAERKVSNLTVALRANGVAVEGE